MRHLLGTIAEAIAQRVGLKLNYLSAKDEPAASISSNRKARREMIEVFRSMPASARALWEKNFFPERVLRTSGGVLQVLGWAPEVFAANAHKLAGKLPQNLSPYTIDPATKTFTPEAWQQLYEDTQTFVANQMGGRTGAGESLVVPRDVAEAGFFKPPQTGEAVGLDQRKADFINCCSECRCRKPRESQKVSSRSTSQVRKSVLRHFPGELRRQLSRVSRLPGSPPKPWE